MDLEGEEEMEEGQVDPHEDVDLAQNEDKEPEPFQGQVLKPSSLGKPGQVTSQARGSDAKSSTHVVPDPTDQAGFNPLALIEQVMSAESTVPFRNDETV